MQPDLRKMQALRRNVRFALRQMQPKLEHVSAKQLADRYWLRSDLDPLRYRLRPGVEWLYTGMESVYPDRSQCRDHADRRKRAGDL